MHSISYLLPGVLCVFLLSGLNLPAEEETAVLEPEPVVAEEPVVTEEPEEVAGESIDGDPADEPAERPLRRHEQVRWTPMAMPSYAPFGESQRGMPPVVNPAMPSLSDRRFRFGTLFDFGFGMEIGDADDFDREIEDLLDRFELLEEQAEQFADNAPTPEQTEAFLADLDDFVDFANELVRDFTDKAYAKLTASASAPLVPIAIRSDFLRGTLSFNASGILEARAAVESVGDAFPVNLKDIDPQNDVVEFDTDPDDVPVIVVNGDRRRLEPTDDAGIAVQGGMVRKIGAGYSRPVWENHRGRLHAGTTVNFFRTTLVRGGVLFNDDDFEDTARDEFEDNQRSTNGFGVDLGAAWFGSWYMLGAVARNINEPSFDYPDTSDSAFFNANPQARRNGERWTMDRQFTLQGAVHSPRRRWLLTGAIDLNSATDTTGDDYQWAGIMGSYEPGRAWVPSPRVGLRSNLTGEELTYVTGGLTFFRALHLDVASTLESVRLDGSKYPRGLQANIGLGRRF
jgi:hypothetical protein